MGQLDEPRRRWPPKCCVVAFLGSAVTALSGCPEVISDEAVRSELARLLDVTLAPEDPNPWNLPKSTNESDWGVNPKVARLMFDQVQGLLGATKILALDIVSINRIAFEQYEDAVLELAQAGAVVGIGFDYPYLLRLSNGTSSAISEKSSPHLVRLTPLGSETEALPSIRSSEFTFDYTGEVAVFDDSLEMGDRGLLVGWRSLVTACRAIDGAFWGVRPT